MRFLIELDTLAVEGHRVFNDFSKWSWSVKPRAQVEGVVNWVYKERTMKCRMHEALEAALQDLAEVARKHAEEARDELVGFE